VRRFRRHRSHEFRTRPTIGYWLSAPFRFIVERAGGDVDELGERPPLGKRIWRLLIQTLFFPFYCIYQLLQFIVLSWTTTRSISAFFWGLMPLLIASSVIAATIVCNFQEDRLARRPHREFTIDAEEVDDFEGALLGSKRVQLISVEPQWQFYHALTLMNAGLEKNARVIFNQLAPLDEKGHLPSHMFLARELIAQYGEERNQPELLDEALVHLNHVLAGEPEDVHTHILKGRILYEQGKIEEAMQIFEQISGLEPSVVPELATWLIENGKFEQARFHIQRGLDRLRQMAEDRPNEPLIWEVMFRILMVSEDYQMAADELNKAFARVEDRRIKLRLLQLQSEVMVEFAKKFNIEDSQDSLRRRMILVSNAIQLNTRNATALEMLVDMVLYPPSEEIETWVEDESLTSISPPIFHLIRGVQHAISGKPVSAQQHLQLALGANKEAAIVVNDLAMVLATAKERPEDALKVINVAIDSWPGPRLFQTRGEILMLLDRPGEALPELEYAASEIKNDPGVFESLAKCHEALGNAAEAGRWRKQAEEKTEELKRAAEERQRKS
jgi:predicted Zn-dependent protease